MAKGLFRMEATVPSRIDIERWTRSLRFMASETASDIREDFELTTETFDKPVKFSKRGWLSGGQVKMSVTTTDENYLRLNKGVKGGYKIPRDGPGLMVFQTGYKAKTDPKRLSRGFIKPMEGGPFGDLIFVNTQITAKGFPPREFDKAIKEMWEEPIKRRLQLAMAGPFRKHMSLSLLRELRVWRRQSKDMPERKF